MNPETIMIDNVKYVREDSTNRPAETADGAPFCIVRSADAGVFAGYIELQNESARAVVIDHCVRMWRWTGATLSQVARDGIAGTGENKFSVPTRHHLVFGVCEIIPATQKAHDAIYSVQPWEV